MSTVRLPQYFAPTYSLMIINQCGALQTIIEQHTQQIKDQQPEPSVDSESIMARLISSAQLSDILNGPFAPFIKLAMRSYAIIVFINQQLSIDTEGAFDESKEALPDLKRLDRAGLKKLSVSEIERLMDSLDKLILELNAQWLNQLNTWLNQLQSELAKNQCQLNSNNSEELFLCYPLSELIDRLQDLKIEPPKIKKNQSVSFTQYLQMKAHIAIQNQLNQQQASDIDAKSKNLIKIIKKVTKPIAEEEQALLQSHQETIEQHLAVTEFAQSVLEKTQA